MKTFCCLRLLLAEGLASAAFCAAGCGVVRHVPPGQSVAFSMAKKAEVVALAPTENVTQGSATEATHPAPAPMPAASFDAEQVADSFTLGNFCMEQGRYPEAIAAYEAAVRINPHFADAWTKLAVAYQNLGEDKKALDAFRKSKSASMP
jgi:tetratricopeptide (TPR) repeat protein